MYKVLHDYTGDAKGCMSIKAGDIISGAHEIENGWLIGRNDTTGETGAFPASYVQTVQKDPPWSAPEMTVILHKESLKRKSSKPKSLMKFTRFTNADDREVKNQKEVGLESQVSNVSSVWSEFDDPNYQDPEHAHPTTSDGPMKKNRKDVAANDKGGSKYKKLKETGRKLFKSKRGENRIQKAIFGAISGLIVAPLLFVVLVYSFGYTHLGAGIIVAISTVLICVGLALSTLCRCILALVIPNFFTGKGRAVFLSIIFGYLLSHPIEDITYNTREAANTMSCIADIVKNQSKALQRQLMEPASDITNYVVQQKQKFEAITRGMIENVFNPVSKAFSELKKAGDEANQALSLVYKECVLNINKGIAECTKVASSTACSSIPFVNPCAKACNYLGEQINSVCDPTKDMDVLVSRVATETQKELNTTLDYFRVDLRATAHYSGNANSSKSADQIQDEVMEDLEGKVDVIKGLFSFIKKFISLSLALLFLESFWYLRNYLGKDNYENFYITSQFKALDAENEKNERPHVLPLKAKEKDVYVDTTSVKMASREVGYIKFGLLIVAVHFTLCLLILLFNYSLYYILSLIKVHGNVDINVEGEGAVSVSVEGKGFVADIFRTLLEEIDISEEYMANLSISKCLPEPAKPSEADIPILMVLYIVAVLFVVLKAYGMRLRLKIAGYYYPEQQLARIEYLHKRIRHKRVGFLRFIRQQVQSSYKEARVTDRLTFSTWLASHFPCMEHCPCFNERRARECTSCGISERPFNDIKLTKCDGKDGTCDATYCQDCYTDLQNSCPLCSDDQEVILRE